MPRVTVPAGEDPAQYVWEKLAPHVSRSAQAYSAGVYANTRLSLREMEAARYRISLLNGCEACQQWRSARDNAGYVGHIGVSDQHANFRDAARIPEDFYASVPLWREAKCFTPRERLAIEFADRFARDHLSLDNANELWGELHEHFNDSELVDLALSVASWVAFGRFTRVFDIDGGNRVQLS